MCIETCQRLKFESLYDNFKLICFAFEVCQKFKAHLIYGLEA